MEEKFKNLPLRNGVGIVVLNKENSNHDCCANAHNKGIQNPEMPVADCAPDEPPCNRDANGIGDCVVNLLFRIEKV